MAKIGEMQVVDLIEYNREGFAVELFSYWQADEPYWAMPDWTERGAGNLEGPFATREEAGAALREHLECMA